MRKKNEISEKSVAGNLQGGQFEQRGSGRSQITRCFGMSSKEMEAADVNHSLEKRKSVISQSDSWTRSRHARTDFRRKDLNVGF